MTPYARPREEMGMKSTAPLLTIIVLVVGLTPASGEDPR
jgi:hypothetical protein